MLMHRIMTLCLAVVCLFVTPVGVFAQLSSPNSSRTLSEEMAWSRTVVLAEWQSVVRNGDESASTTLKIVRILKGGAGSWQVGDLTQLSYDAPGKPGHKFLLYSDSSDGKEWTESRSVTPTTIQYIAELPGLEVTPAKRLSYFIRHLDSSDARIADDAEHELAILVVKHAAGLPQKDIVRLQAYVTQPAKQDEFRLGLDRAIAGYLLAVGEPGLDVIENSLLKNKQAAIVDTYAAMSAMRFLWDLAPQNISQDRLRQSMRLLLDHRDLNDLVIVNLAQWKDWSAQDRVKRMYDAADKNGNIRQSVNRAVIRYMLMCSNDVPVGKTDQPPKRVLAARAFLAKLKKQDPQGLRRAEAFHQPDRKVENKLKQGRIDAVGELDRVASGLSFMPVYSSAIHTLAFTPNEKAIVSGSGSGITRWWDVATGRRIESVRAHRTWCFSIAFSPNGELMATGSGDQSIKLWDSSRRRPVAMFEGHTDDVHAVAFDPAGAQLYSAGDDMVVRAFHLKDGSVSRQMEGHTEPIPCLAVSRDGQWIATGSRDDTVRIWDARTGKVRHTLKGHTNDVHSVSFSPDGKTLASASYDETVKLWEVETGKLQRTLREHANWVFSVTYSQDGKLLASADKDGRIVIWNPNTGKKVGILKRQRHVSCVAFSPDGAILASSSPYATICLWNPQTLTFQRELNVPQDEKEIRKIDSVERKK